MDNTENRNVKRCICFGCWLQAGVLATVENGKLVKLKGEPDHPVNQGSLCSKGMALAQLNTVDGEINSKRLQKVKYRAPGSSKWEDVDWSWAIEQIARRIKDTRDKNLIATDGEGRSVNRLEAIASLGGAALDNEECSLIVKAMRALGLVYIEHQARI